VKKLLLCLFSYNRSLLLANAVKSIEEFLPWGDRLLIDDGSSDPGVVSLTDDIKKRRSWRCIVRDRHDKRTYGGFYNNMRLALEFALEKEYDYCFFFEDDQQLLWQKTDYREYLDHVFGSCPDAIQVQPLFFRRILSYAHSVEYIQPANAYRTERGFNTTAIWNVAVVRKHPDYQFISDHGDDLPANSAYWLRKGYRLYMQFDPTVAIMPWIPSQSVQSSRRALSEAQSQNGDYFLEPLNEAKIRFLRSRLPALPAYQEHFVQQAGTPIRPIWHQQRHNLNRFYELCRIMVDEENALGSSPAGIPVLNEWQTTKIPPLQSHLMWNPYRVGQDIPWWRKTLGRLTSHLPKWIADWRQFRMRNYLGYLTLKRRLKCEVDNLPFSKQ
jgi:hypothetical protein